VAGNRSLSSLIARLTGKVYPKGQAGVDELARDFAEGIAGLARQPGLSRGLANNVVTDVQGGTSLGVGDPSAGLISDVLVQNSQPGVANDIGSGLKTRRQTRVETRTRVLPATVVTAAEAGDATVRVRVSAEGVDKTQDQLTQSEVVGDLDIAQGTEYDAAMTGQPIVIEGGSGIQPISAGRTVDVMLTENWEVTTTNTVRDRKNIPSVVRVLRNTTAALVNGFACKGTVCVPVQVFVPNFALNAPPQPAVDWEFSDTFEDQVGRAWGVVIFPVDMPSGTIDLSSFGYYAYGVVPPGGVISFTGIPQTYADTNSQWTNYDESIPNVPYNYGVFVGCNQGQQVDFGSVTQVGDIPGFPAREWFFTDSNFPDPL
jgi:hypothetical protein